MIVRCIAHGCVAPRADAEPFCKVHRLATTGQRGGWISAERRRRQRGQLEHALNASNIFKRLWVGGKPPFDRDLPDFDVLFLCAQEIQPPKVSFHGYTIRVPLDDHSPTAEEVQRALAGGKQVAEALVGGKCVLVTCHMGWNRSALVAGLGLGLVTRMSAQQIVELMKKRRSEDCLGNVHFQDVLHRYIGNGRRPTARPRR